MTYSVNTINIDKTFSNTLVTATVSGTYDLDLSLSNSYKLTLSGDTILEYSNPQISTYNILVDTAGNNFQLSGTSSYRAIGATVISTTFSSIVSGVYDGSDLWVSYIENII